MVGCGECDGTNNHFGHGQQHFLYRGMNHSEIGRRNLTIEPWDPEPGDLVLNRSSLPSLDIRPNCKAPTATPTVCDPLLRTVNTQAECGAPEDIYYYSPWRYPGNAPVIDACGTAGGRFPGQGNGAAGAIFQNSSVAKQGDLGSHLPQTKQPEAVWQAGAHVEVGWTVMANHGGGYAYRLAPADGPLTEAVFRKLPLDFVGLAALRWDGDKTSQLEFNATERGWETRVGTVPMGSTWRKNPIPAGLWEREGPAFRPVCEESEECKRASSQDIWGAPAGVCRCSGFSNGGPLLPNLEMVDRLEIPSSLSPGRYVLQWRWDCEEVYVQHLDPWTCPAPFCCSQIPGSSSCVARRHRFGPRAATWK